ncbi:hypothetical protein J522_1980 [Acinetobacter baumannii 146457]|nr:hypothetical protein J522_1980 [Acinetobacter baumannii 146457]
MKYFTLILTSMTFVILITIFFYKLTGVVFDVSNTTNATRLTLAIYFFSGISTLGAVLAAFYTLHIQSLTKRPTIILQIIGLKVQWSDLIQKYVLSIRIKMLNTGGNAFFLRLDLSHRSNNENDIKYGFNNCRNDFDIVKNITEKEEPYYLTINFNVINESTLFEDVSNLKPFIELKYTDSENVQHKQIYLIKYTKKLDKSDFFELSKQKLFDKLIK